MSWLIMIYWNRGRGVTWVQNFPKLRKILKYTGAINIWAALIKNVFCMFRGRKHHILRYRVILKHFQKVLFQYVHWVEIFLHSISFYVKILYRMCICKLSKFYHSIPVCEKVWFTWEHKREPHLKLQFSNLHSGLCLIDLHRMTFQCQTFLTGYGGH